MKLFKLTVIVMLALASLSMTLQAQTTSAPDVSGQVAVVAPTNATKDDRYLIGFQDVIDVQVFRHPELNKRVTVDPSGVIYLNRLDSPVMAVCKTERQLANDIEAAYKVKYLRDPQVNVNMVEQKSQPMAVIGAVEKPGSFFVTHKVHLLELLAMAGGPNKEAGTRVLVARTGSSSNCRTADSGNEAGDDVSLMSFKIRDIREGKKILWMQPGDVVSVLDADIVYVYGNVNEQGEIKVREPITLTQAIASARGLKSATKMDHIRILRQKGDGLDREELVFNLKDIDAGKTRDPYLEPNDIVAVSQDSTKSILLGVGNALRYSIPTMITRVPIP